MALAENGPRDVRQVWFPGVHSDVGGGYPEAESGLAKITLEWMASEAQQAGLLLDRARLGLLLGQGPGRGMAAPDPNGPMHDSLRGAWWLAEVVPKRRFDPATGQARWHLYRNSPRRPPPQPLVHEAAWLRRDYPLPAGAVRVTTTPL